MFFFDIETLGSESTSVLLSIGAIHVPEGVKVTSVDQLLADTFFVKFDTIEQIRRKRVIQKSTVDWWAKQSLLARETSFIKSDRDVEVVEALTRYADWVKSHPTYKKEMIWVRGSLDQMAYDSLCECFDVKPVFNYNEYRDIRTAVDIIYPNSRGGYVEVDPNKCSGFADKQWIKHNPVHDCLIDAAMLFCGKE